ncbi:MAG: class I tRNA ligase family protein, partial [Elusimicrobia bacterium]|nr:class I tRNA ligase family protein [Elusimicrobiota bacterium]
MLHRLAGLIERVRAAYAEFRYRDAARELVDFCNLDLSSFFLDACKDKVYTFSRQAPERRGAQTVMYRCLESLLTLAAPILSFTAEEAWVELRRIQGELQAKPLPESVFLAQLPKAEPRWRDEALAQRWASVLEARGVVQKGVEELRAQKKLGSSLQARVRLKGGGAARPVLESMK